MHAGILTTPQMIWLADAPRPRLKVYSYLLFCNDIKSTRVDTSVVLGLGTADLRDGEGWQKLVKLPGCNACHARLDYGVRFFTGWGDSRKSFVFHPENQVSEEGHLYLTGYSDLRATGVTTPRTFAELAVKQPEFATCQAQNVLDYVLGDDSTSELRDAVLATAEPKLKLRPMMRVALRQYAARYEASEEPAADALAATISAAPQSFKSDGSVALSTELQAKLQRACTDCHHAGQDAVPSFEVDRLPLPLLRDMVKRVAFGAMPPDGLDERERSSILAAAVPLGWPTSAAETYAFFNNQLRSLLVHHPASLIMSIRAHGGDTAPALPLPQIPEIRMNQRQVQLTPSFAASLMLESLKACKRGAHPDDAKAIEICLKKFKLESVIRSPR